MEEGLNLETEVPPPSQPPPPSLELECILATNRFRYSPGWNKARANVKALLKSLEKCFNSTTTSDSSCYTLAHYILHQIVDTLLRNDEVVYSNESPNYFLSRVIGKIWTKYQDVARKIEGDDRVMTLERKRLLIKILTLKDHHPKCPHLGKDSWTSKIFLKNHLKSIEWDNGNNDCSSFYPNQFKSPPPDGRSTTISVDWEELVLIHATSSANLVNMLRRPIYTTSDELLLEGKPATSQYIHPEGFVWFGVDMSDKLGQLDGNCTKAKQYASENRYGPIVIKVPLRSVVRAGGWPGDLHCYNLGTRVYQFEHSQTILLTNTRNQGQRDTPEPWFLYAHGNEKGENSIALELDCVVGLEKMGWDLSYNGTGDWTHREFAILGDVSVPLNECKISFVEHRSCVGRNRKGRGCDCEENRLETEQVLANLAKLLISDQLETLLKNESIFENSKVLQRIVNFREAPKLITNEEEVVDEPAEKQRKLS